MYGPNTRKLVSNRTAAWKSTAENSESWFLTVQLSLNDLCYILSTQFSGILSLDPAEFSKYFFHLSALADGSL